MTCHRICFLCWIYYCCPGQGQFLNGRHDDLVGVVFGQQTPYKGGGVGVFLNAVLLETVEFLAGLAVEILAVDNKETLVDVVVGLEQGRSLEGG